MGELLKKEKELQTAWKLRTNTLTEEAKKNGSFKGRALSYFLDNNHTDQNLFEGIREKSIEYFKNHGIPWHDNNGDYPSGHLCDSQVCCVNFLMPLTASEEVTIELFKRYFPDINKIISLDNDSFMAFEWIGAKNYLKERILKGSERTRGALCTSVDGAIMFETSKGKKIIVLIEWKYTESYKPISYKYAKKDRDRALIYKHLWDMETCPIDKEKVNNFDDLFYEPFYQFTRQQFLANEMELANEYSCDEVYLMHLSPRANKDFRAVTSHNLKSLGDSATEVWRKLNKNKSRFIPMYIEDFFDKHIITKNESMKPYWDYLVDRYVTIINNE